MRSIRCVKLRYIPYTTGCVVHTILSMTPLPSLGEDIEIYCNNLDDNDFWDLFRHERLPWIMRNWSMEDLRRYAILLKDRTILSLFSRRPILPRRWFIPPNAAEFENYFEDLSNEAFWGFIRSATYPLEVSFWPRENLQTFLDMYRDRFILDEWICVLRIDERGLGIADNGGVFRRQPGWGQYLPN